MGAHAVMTNMVAVRTAIGYWKMDFVFDMGFDCCWIERILKGVREIKGVRGIKGVKGIRGGIVKTGQFYANISFTTCP